MVFGLLQPHWKLTQRPLVVSVVDYGLGNPCPAILCSLAGALFLGFGKLKAVPQRRHVFRSGVGHTLGRVDAAGIQKQLVHGIAVQEVRKWGLQQLAQSMLPPTGPGQAKSQSDPAASPGCERRQRAGETRRAADGSEVKFKGELALPPAAG